MGASTRGWALNNFFGHQGRRRLFEVVSLFESIRTYKTILKLNPAIATDWRDNFKYSIYLHSIVFLKYKL